MKQPFLRGKEKRNFCLYMTLTLLSLMSLSVISFIIYCYISIPQLINQGKNEEDRIDEYFDNIDGMIDDFGGWDNFTYEIEKAIYAMNQICNYIDCPSL